MYYYDPVSTPTPGSGERFVPVPMIDIEPEILYANDSVVGYNYIITFNGYATALDLTENNPTLSGSFKKTSEKIKKIRDIFNFNGGTLLVKDDLGIVLKATGGWVESLQFDPTDNNWVNYAKYTAKLSFNELHLSDCTNINITSCGSIPSGISDSDSPNLIDMQKHKIKSFTDGWSFDGGDTIFNANNKFHNEYIPISYTINATGKHYFKDDKLIPAWEQAKNFCQERLHTQASRLIQNIMKRSGTSTCDGNATLATMFASGPPGIIDGLSNTNYDIFNETIECSASESDGGFNATYNAYLKRTLTGDTLSDPKSIHTHTVDRSRQRDLSGDIITITVNGNIQGLITGGLINDHDILEFPATGVLVKTSSNPTETKYKNALTAYNKLMDGKELKCSFISGIGVTYANLNVETSCSALTGCPPVKTHSSTHNYTEGSITYTATYDNQIGCKPTGVEYNEISISIEDPLPVIAEFIIPGRVAGPIVQRFPATTSRKVSVSMNGYVPQTCVKDFAALTSNACSNGLPLPSGIPGPYIGGSLKLLSNDHNLNYIDGSFTINRSYICCGE